MRLSCFKDGFREQLKEARTHDAFWNAAQLELLWTGKMQGYMRMYWCKQIMDWSPSMQEAFEVGLSFLDIRSIGQQPITDH